MARQELVVLDGAEVVGTLARTAGEITFTGDDVLGRIEQIAAQLPTAMAAAAQEPRVLELDSPLPPRLTELVENRCRALVAHLR